MCLCSMLLAVKEKDNKGHAVREGVAVHQSDNIVIDEFKLADGRTVRVTKCKLCGIKLTRKF